MTHAKAPRNGGVTNDARINARITRLPGRCVVPCSPLTLTHASQPSGRIMSRTSVTAVVIQTGTDRSNVLSSASGLRAEELDEALLDLFIALLQLLGIDGEELELRHLRLVGR